MTSPFRNLQEQATFEGDHEIAVQPDGDVPPKRLSLSRMFNAIRAGLVGPTNLSVTYPVAGDSFRVNSSTGQPAPVLAATDAHAGAYPAAHKRKMDTIETNAKDDQTAAEIEAILDAYFGNTNWRRNLAGALRLSLVDDPADFAVIRAGANPANLALATATFARGAADIYLVDGTRPDNVNTGDLYVFDHTDNRWERGIRLPDAIAGAITNLTNQRTATTVTIVSSTGNNTEIPEADANGSGEAGVQSAANAIKVKRQDENPRSTPATRTGPWTPLQQYQWHSPGGPGFAKGDLSITAPTGNTRHVIFFFGDDDIASGAPSLLMELAAAGSRIKVLKNDGTVAYEATLIAGINEIVAGQWRVNTTSISYAAQADNTPLTVEIQSAIDAKNARQDAAINAKAEKTDLPPFATITLEPAGIAGLTPEHMPDYIDVNLSEKLTDKEISAVVFNLQGENLNLDANTPLSSINEPTEQFGTLRYLLPATDKGTLAGNLGANSRYLQVQMTFSFTDGSPNHIHNMAWLVNSASQTRQRLHDIAPSGANNRTLQAPTNYREFQFVQIDWNTENSNNGDRATLLIRVNRLPTNGTRLYRSGGGADITWNAANRQFTLSEGSFEGGSLMRLV